MPIGKKIFLRCWCEGRFQKLAKAVMDMNKISKVKGQPLGHVPCASMSTKFCQKSIKGLFFQYLLQTANKGSYNTAAAIKDALLLYRSSPLHKKIILTLILWARVIYQLNSVTHKSSHRTSDTHKSQKVTHKSSHITSHTSQITQQY